MPTLSNPWASATRTALSLNGARVWFIQSSHGVTDGCRENATFGKPLTMSTCSLVMRKRLSTSPVSSWFSSVFASVTILKTIVSRYG